MGFRSFAALGAVLMLSATAAGADRPDVVFADFESATYAPWRAEGPAFGDGPAEGTLPGQMAVSGYEGRRLVNSFRGGDSGTGTLTSPEFRVERAFIRFLIGGGGHAGETCANLVVDGRVVRTASGPNTSPGGSEELAPAAWDVADLAGATARIEVVDRATGGWGHINFDHVVFTDAKPPGVIRDASRTLVAEARYLQFPVRTGAPKRVVTVAVDGREERRFDIELAPGEPEWWAPLEIGPWAGRELTIRVDRLPEDSAALDSLRQADRIEGSDGLYRERLRPQLHFSARRGWLNDPNGLAYYKGEYHLFFQHNPYGWDWGNMHWGHAVSRDLVRWEELGEALYPDPMGPMFSGSAAVDRKNTSGLGRGGEPPLLLFYTAAGNPAVQCLAWTLDGREIHKYEQNPILEQITPGNRDPKVFWHEPTGRWVMVLYVELPGPAGSKEPRHTIHIFTSADAKAWTLESVVDGFFECPDLFPLGFDGQTEWVITGASSEYMLGSFDGKTFTPETPKLPGHRGKGFYAAQTYGDIPESDGRRLQFGWLRAPSPGMPFNQCMSLPLELKRRETPEGPRLAWAPARELGTLRARSDRREGVALEAGGEPVRPAVEGELLEVRAVVEPAPDAVVRLDVRGVPIVYRAADQELEVAGHRAPAPLRDGVLDLAIYADRTVFEVFAADGLTYVPIPVIPDADATRVEVRAEAGSARLRSLDVHALRSIWD